jgi:hypothetical protein
MDRNGGKIIFKCKMEIEMRIILNDGKNKITSR